ncbi:MAG: DUF58 domain-containing protein [Desulfosudaceae bacterium]
MTLVPRNRLIFWTAATVLPGALVNALLPPGGPSWYLPALVVLLAALGDALAARRQEDQPVPEFPELVRLTQHREGTVDFGIVQDRPGTERVRLGPDWPAGLTAERDRTFDLAPETGENRFSWTCTPAQRGEFTVDRCHVETDSPLGLWALRRRLPVAMKVRVYPDLSAEKKNFAWLFSGRETGVHALRQVGKGREFEQLREYLPGDSYEDIHWKATARRGFPVTKTYQIERTQEVYLIIDASRLSARPAGAATRSCLDRFITTALVSGLAIERQGDLFGLLTFDDRIRGFVPAKKGRAHYDTCRDMLYNLSARPVSPDFTELFSFMAANLRKRALLVFLTSLDDPVLADSFTGQVHLLTRRHVVLVNMIRPDGVTPVFAGGAVRQPDDLYPALAGHLEWDNLARTSTRLRRRGVDFAMVPAEQLSLRLTRQYLAVKRSQRL